MIRMDHQCIHSRRCILPAGSRVQQIGRSMINEILQKDISLTWEEAEVTVVAPQSECGTVFLLGRRLNQGQGQDQNFLAFVATQIDVVWPPFRRLRLGLGLALAAPRPFGMEKRCKVGPKLLYLSLEVAYARFRLVPTSMTLDDLERPLCTVFRYTRLLKSTTKI